MVDVRDVARAHVVAMEKSNAKGRYICCNETKSMAEIAEFVRPRYPNCPVPTRDLTAWWTDVVVRGASYLQPSGLGQYVRTNLGRVPDIDHSKIRKELGFEFTDIWTSISDTCDDLIRKGHVKCSSKL